MVMTLFVVVIMMVTVIATMRMRMIVMVMSVRVMRAHGGVPFACLSQIALDDVDEFLGRIGLSGSRLLIRVHDVHSDMPFEHLGH